MKENKNLPYESWENIEKELFNEEEIQENHKKIAKIHDNFVKKETKRLKKKYKVDFYYDESINDFLPVNKENEYDRLDNKFSHELILARKEKGLTQKDLEEKTGIKQAMIARIESGVTSPTISTAIKLLKALDKTIEVIDIN